MSTINVNFKKLAREITIVENELQGYEQILEQAISSKCPIIGITGAPGAGKSTLVNAICNQLVLNNATIAIIAVDPTSAFNYGSILGDRLRMHNLFVNNNIYIRSVATRGALGGLCEKIIEITSVVQSYPFDFIIIETVGVGQSEVEIAGLADITVLALTPEGGDDVQMMKSGVIEIADLFVINKADRPGADIFESKLIMQMQINHKNIPIVKTVAAQNIGIEVLVTHLLELKNKETANTKNLNLLSNKAYKLIQHYKMKGLNKNELIASIEKVYREKDFNVFKFIKQYI